MSHNVCFLLYGEGTERKYEKHFRRKENAGKLIKRISVMSPQNLEIERRIGEDKSETNRIYLYRAAEGMGLQRPVSFPMISSAIGAASPTASEWKSNIDQNLK